MADKLTQQIVDALGKAAAEPTGLPLFATKAEPGLFASTAKPAAQKCLTDKLLHIVGKSSRELYAPTEAGWEFLLAAVNPQQVLEDFVRVLEERQGEVGELLGTARQMAESLQGLKDAVSRVLPRVSVKRITVPANRELEFAGMRGTSFQAVECDRLETCPTGKGISGWLAQRMIPLIPLSGLATAGIGPETHDRDALR